MSWLAASMPSWNELRSTDVSRGEVSLAKSELLKEMIEISSGMDSPRVRHTRSSVTPSRSSLTTMAVGLSARSISARRAASSISSAVISTQ